MRIRPGCSTTKSRPLPSRALTTASGLFRFVTTGSSRIDRAAGSKLPLGGGSDDALGPTVGPGLADAPGLGLDGVADGLEVADGPVVADRPASEPQATTTSSAATASAA